MKQSLPFSSSVYENSCREAITSYSGYLVEISKKLKYENLLYLGFSIIDAKSDMFFYYIAIYFLAASIVVFASPISYDPNGLIETGVTKQSSVEGIPDIVAFNPDLKAQSLDDDSTFSRTVSADTSTIPDLDTENNTMTVSDRGCITNDHTDDATQKRNILRRLNPQTACPTTGLIPTTNPTRVKTPTSPSILRGFKTQTQKKTTTPDRNPCVGYSRLAGVPQTIHVSCGGPVVGDFPSDPDIVFDCMPGKSFVCK